MNAVVDNNILLPRVRITKEYGKRRTWQIYVFLCRHFYFSLVYSIVSSQIFLFRLETHNKVED